MEIIFCPSLQRTTLVGTGVTRYQGSGTVCWFALRRSTEKIKHATRLSYTQILWKI
jgi:hypothetical protein